MRKLIFINFVSVACILIALELIANFFKSGNQASIKVLFLDNREATITYSLSGFTAGYEKLSSVETN